MVHGLLRGKIGDVGGRNPFEVEDLLTSVVLGAASYVEPERALLPFLREARSASREPLPVPIEPVSVDCDFWPNAWAGVVPEPDGSAAGIDGGQPEVVVRLDQPGERGSVLLVEVKLRSGISSSATPQGPVAHQLAKYWLHLLRVAKAEDRRPLGVVFVTEGIRFPSADIEEATDELRAKGCPEGAFFWVSWRRFERVVEPDGCRILADVLRLLREQWGLTWVDDAWVWPREVAPGAPAAFFGESWSWPTPRSSTCPEAWFHG